MKRAFLVFGAESSACRYVTSVFVASGCSGDDGHVQRFDQDLGLAGETMVWRRSFPHGGQWPDIIWMVNQLRSRGYEDITVIITIRDERSMIESQLRAGHVQNREQAKRQIRRAYATIFGEVHRLDLPYRIAVYESYVHNPRALEYLLHSCGLSCRRPIVPRNENLKYY